MTSTKKIVLSFHAYLTKKMKSSILKKFAEKLNKAASLNLGNTPFTSRELQEHAEATPGPWELLNTEDNRVTRRGKISDSNFRRYMRNFGNAIQSWNDRMQFMHMIEERRKVNEKAMAEQELLAAA